VKAPSVSGCARGREGGVEALNAHPPQGVKPKLTREQKAQLPELLAKGAQSYGFRGDVWIASRVAEVIARTDRECALTAIPSDASCARRAGVDNSPRSGPASALREKQARLGACDESESA
jgi:hypothetical protein